MKSIFCKLPLDIIKYILLYDEHFIMRKGEIVSIIPKTDYRYILLNLAKITANTYNVTIRSIFKTKA